MKFRSWSCRVRNTSKAQSIKNVDYILRLIARMTRVVLIVSGLGKKLVAALPCTGGQAEKLNSLS